MKAPAQSPRITLRPQPAAPAPVAGRAAAALPAGAPPPATPATPAAAPAAPKLRPRLVEVKAAGPASAPAPAPSAMPSPAAPQQPEPISRFIDLEVEARRCADLDALRFAVVNSTRKLAHFDQAFLAEPDLAGSWSITRASSVATVDRNSEAVRQLTDWIAQSSTTAGAGLGEPRLTNLVADLEQPGASPFPYLLWVPIKARDGRPLAALVALKAESWRPQHSALLLPLADAYGHAWEALAPRTAAHAAHIRRHLSRSRLALAALGAALLAAFIPVPMSTLAPAEIAAADPMLVTAPIDGVIGDILPAPGSWVEKGKPIVRFVDVKLRNDVEVARRNKAVAEARHFKVMQSSIATQKDMQDLATTKAEFDVAAAELQFAEDMLARSVIRAERSGLVIYSAKSDWLGKPVSTGERLMEIGDPASTEIKIDLPVSDAIVVEPGNTVSLFLDGSPLGAIGGRITRTSYRPVATPDQQMVFRLYARFADDQPRKIGLRGVARVSSQTVSLWFYLLRRPIAAARQRLGL